jgi:DNA mismatch endonuclease (patch repair protein)
MDRIAKEKRSKVMSAIHSRDTKPELMLRKALRQCGYRYRLHYGKEKVDVAFPEKKVAVFVDGCFWHSCPLHLRIPKSNKGYWLPKLRKNIQRAREKDKRLKEKGWKIIHIWEHEFEKPRVAVKRIERLIKSQ